MDNSIQIVYQGYSPNSEGIYVCPNSLSKISECYKLNNCTRVSYDENKEENTFKCSKEINYYERNYIIFQKIVMQDYCWNYINASISYIFNNNNDSNSNINYNSSDYKNTSDSNHSHTYYNSSEENVKNSAFIKSINLFMVLIALLIFI